LFFILGDERDVYAGLTGFPVFEESTMVDGNGFFVEET